MGTELLRIKLLLLSCCILFFTSLTAQQFIPGEVYFDSTQFVEYRAGNLPIILSAPHGGSLRPEAIPDRDCETCTTSQDSFTQPISEAVYDAILEETGCFPHLVINLLHRVKFDANRDVGEAALGNQTVEQAWRGYHAFIDSAKIQAEINYGRGLFLDLHGHAHTIQRIELGYLLSRSELQLTNEELDTDKFIQESSIRSLVGDNQLNLSHSELLRGENSFGTLLSNSGLPAVPSMQDPFPSMQDPFFSGGFNTVRHGSRDNGGAIDAIQIEMNQDIRFDEEMREMLVDSIANVILDYIDIHYNEDFSVNFCNIISDASNIPKNQNGFTLYPNPGRDILYIETKQNSYEVNIFNFLGQRLWTKKDVGNSLDISFLSPGFYLLQFSKDGILFGSESLLVK